MPVSASARRRGIRRNARWRFVLRVLGVLRLVEQQAVPLEPREELDVPRGDVVRRDDDVAPSGDLEEGVARETRRPVVKMDPEPRREAGDLARPLLRDAHRADDQCRPDVPVVSALPLGDDRRDRLHGLPEPHVVGEDPAHAQVAEQP